MSNQGSDSKEQRDAERVILAKLAETLSQEYGRPIRLDHPKPKAWNMEMDGYCPDPLIFVEAWARIGVASASQQHKVVVDFFKMHYAEDLSGQKAHKILAVMSEDCTKFLQGKSWKKSAAERYGIEVRLVEVPIETLESVQKAQVRQGEKQTRSLPAIPETMAQFSGPNTFLEDDLEAAQEA